MGPLAPTAVKSRAYVYIPSAYTLRRWVSRDPASIAAQIHDSFSINQLSHALRMAQRLRKQVQVRQITCSCCGELYTKGIAIPENEMRMKILQKVALLSFERNSDGNFFAVDIASRNGNTGIVDGSTAPIPEPATYAMLLAGLGLMGIIARRRKSN